MRTELAAPAPILPLPERLAVGIPADTLRQRPDVRAAERKLAARDRAHRPGRGGALSEFQPERFDRSRSADPRRLGRQRNAGPVLGGGVAATLFDGGRLRQQVEIQSAVQEQALVSYEATVLTALEEVENALVALANSRSREEALRSAADAARNAALLARHRYTSGLIDFQTVLDTERTVLTVEDSVAVTQADGASALVQLYKALGGGWSAAAGAMSGQGHR